LPTVDDSKGATITLKNRGSGDVTVQSTEGNKIYTVDAVANFTMAPNESYQLLNNGTYWVRD
jgi:hypothetical protein